MNYTSINNAFNLNNDNYETWVENANDYDYDTETDNNVNNIVNSIVNPNVNDNDNDNVNVNEKKDIEKEKDINADKLLKDYNNINNLLKININSINRLEIEKNEIFTYKSSIFSKHQDIMIKLYKKEFGEMKEINDINDNIIKYIELIKNYSDKWTLEYYNKKKKYLETTIKKQEDQLTAYRKLFINTTTEIIKAEKLNKNLCPICFENEINMCSVPCGHTCCNDCITQSIKYNNSRLTKCLSCRNPINDYIRFYIQL
jgi:hypothetical protein